MSYERSTLVVAGVLAALCALYGLEQRKKSKSLPPPPSPPGSYPVIGHAFVMPTDEAHLTFNKWAKELNSDIISLHTLGQTFVVLNSVQSAVDLLEQRSSIYSDRPQLRVIADPDLLGWNLTTGSAPYGNRWKKQRRMTHDVLKSSVNDQHYARMESETRAMLKRMLQETAKPEKEIRRNVAGQIMATVYGYTVSSSDDYFVNGIEKSMEYFGIAATPGNFLVNFIPWLKYVPEWLPGVGWKRKVKQWRIVRDAVANEPFDWAKSQIANGTAAPSMVDTHLSDIGKRPTVNLAEEEDYLKWAAVTLFAAGSDTTVSSTLVFVIAMLRYPEIQARAQKEIDELIGSERLPELNDRSNMPYLRRIVRETIRWQPVTPLGVPRASMQDDVYKGYFIPKGSFVMFNTWGITRDNSTYPDPEVFNPDRFLDPSVPDAPAFGFGRRICPGSSFAEASLFIIFASMLTIFNIKPAKDPLTGKGIIPEPNMTTHALVSHPLPFNCVFEPRSEAHARLLQDF